MLLEMHARFALVLPLKAKWGGEDNEEKYKRAQNHGPTQKASGRATVSPVRSYSKQDRRYMFKLLRPKTTRFAVDLSRLQDPSPYKRWYELSPPEKQLFVSAFSVIFRSRYPASGTSSKLHVLSPPSVDHHDSPSVFGIFYEDIWKVENRTGRNNHRFSDQSFRSLLVRRRI